MTVGTGNEIPQNGAALFECSSCDTLVSAVAATRVKARYVDNQPLWVNACGTEDLTFSTWWITSYGKPIFYLCAK